MDEKPSPEAIGEAAVWMAMLRAPDRTSTVEKGFQHWLAADRNHKAAFEAISAAWEETAALPKHPLPSLRGQRRAGFRQGFLQAALAATVIGVITGAVFYAYGRNTYSTDIGEQRQFTLKDGTRITLNTDTRIVVNYDADKRTILLKSGEALFEVARNPRRPFTVEVGDRSVTALGTSFVVRQDPSRLSVTMMEGKVAINPLSSSSGISEQDPGLQIEEGSGFFLTAGQRATFVSARDSSAARSEAEGGGASVRIDRPSVEKEIAWRTGHVDLAEVRLADAAIEMNRYSETKVTIEDPQTASILITGIFRAGDTANFANAVGNTYGLSVHREGDHITIAGSRPL